MLIIAGPCAIESYDQAMKIAEFVYNAGANIYRGGLFKPRSSPDAYQGMGEKGLHILAEIRKFMPVITEATQVENVDIIAEECDIIQIGSRNMHNVGLLKKAGRTGKDVMLKRGYAANLEEEWINAYKYLKNEMEFYQKEAEIYMCERGIRTFEKYTRNTLDLSSAVALKQKGYNIIVDPSHATGRRELIIPMSLAAVAAGVDGIMVEVHNDPEKALCDGHQALRFYEFTELVDKVTALKQYMENNNL
jgi:3-deoxy-7-phosphoheptulonate synthase